MINNNVDVNVNVNVFLYHEVKEIPAQPGAYIFYSVNEEPLYVGASRNLNRRIKEHFYSSSNTREYSHLFHKVKCIYGTLAIALEDEIIEEVRPVFNICYNNYPSVEKRRRELLNKR